MQIEAPAPISLFAQISELAKKDMIEAMKLIAFHREELVMAFIAKYGLPPEDCVIIEMPYSDEETMGTKVWVEKRPSEFQQIAMLKVEVEEWKAAYEELEIEYDALVGGKDF